ncbi:MAG: F420-dependent methylenetetrahydromethanopterin dehydrogenase [Methanobacteriaceae archaeon]|jgi:methylenetetrahydromethanopterin dehydrogenase|uniref:F420-dependent methylenetetrahydromethanopterin dehydrogenase n=1 Tax=Methanobrevibacter TaxID=2172 RepID=UPI003761920C|nr:F420-dependent methylenetetrahydromethanopterin dehydrogenase [Methanobacteriaceae archaeon]MDD4593945.1 F420-dependent methylenetetrahydromethanopterin dehydrogenase [Methanobacteriaceae archaeon]
MVVKIGIIKSGNIASSPVLELLLDERADRPNIDVRIISSGAKMSPEQTEEVVPKIKDFDPDFCIFTSPNPTAPGPAKARELLSQLDVPAMIIGDTPGLKAKDEMKEQGIGYIIVKADSMIGARREFLDPTEMASFNSDLIKVLACTGAYRLIQNTIDGMIEQAEAGKEIELPQLVVSAEKAADAGDFSNPYAKAKAIAAYTMAEHVADLDLKGCFMVQDFEKFIYLVEAAHETASQAAKLATEAREIEKANDTVLRTPHMKDGSTGSKTVLTEKPQ